MKLRGATMPNPKVAMKAELEEKYRRKYEEKLRKMEEEFKAQLAQAKADFSRQVDMAMQISADGAMMAIDDVFDVNEYSAEKFHLAHIDYVNDICKLTVEDAKDDPDIVYAKADVDRRLLQIVGKDNFVPWDERIGGKCNDR
jgi:hypothetical protein